MRVQRTLIGTRSNVQGAMRNVLGMRRLSQVSGLTLLSLTALELPSHLFAHRNLTNLEHPTTPFTQMGSPCCRWHLLQKVTLTRTFHLNGKETSPTPWPHHAQVQP